uniref:Uncharacterized protein n=1 Tax=viral metagenome TaxID=1070528 RepID=A0A6C0B599_9ZZZZ
MWTYIKSFFSKKGEEREKTKNLSLREKSMILRHSTNSELLNRSLKWTLPGWSQRYVSHTDWTIKIKGDITLPYIEKVNKCVNFISAAQIPIIVNNNKINLQKYIETFGQYSPNININYNLSSSYNESIAMHCVVVIIPKDNTITHIPSKLTHRYDKCSNNILIVSSQKSSISLEEEQRKHDIHLEETMPEIHDKINYNICIEIPVKKYKLINKRDINKEIKGTIVYYLYLDHKTLNNSDIDRIEKIFTNFKNEKYNL